MTERVVAAEAAALGVTARDAPGEAELLPDTTARLEIGSVAAAALADPCARALFVRVTAAVDVSDDDVTDYHARNPLRFAATAPGPRTAGAPRRTSRRRWTRCAPRSPSICGPPRVAEPSGSGSTHAGPQLVRLAPGYEHPGDPRQPDNTHRH